MCSYQEQTLEELSPSYGNFGPTSGTITVSYTHLDVYKRQSHTGQNACDRLYLSPL